MISEDLLYKLLAVSITVVICIILVMISGAAFKRLSRRSKAVHLTFLDSLIKIIIFAIGFFQILSIFEQTRNMGQLFMQGSALLLAITTFAAQQTLGNLISGISISLAHPYSIGDKIKVMSGGSVIAEGLIIDVTVRHTVIKSFDGQSAIVPNSVMDSSVIVNTNYLDNVGNFFEIEIGYDSDIELALDLVEKNLKSHPLVLKERISRPLASRFTANGIILKSTVWTATVDDNFKACSDLRISILEDFKKNSITVPYQTVTIDKN